VVLGVTMPDIGVEAPEVRLDEAVLPFVFPLASPFVVLTDAGFLDHVVVALPGPCDFGAPNAGKASSDAVSRVDWLGAEVAGCSRTGCLPAALADNVGSVGGVAA